MLVLIVIIPEEKLEMPSRLPSPTDLTPLIPGLLIAKKKQNCQLFVVSQCENITWCCVLQLRNRTKVKLKWLCPNVVLFLLLFGVIKKNHKTEMMSRTVSFFLQSKQAFSDIPLLLHSLFVFYQFAHLSLLHGFIRLLDV